MLKPVYKFPSAAVAIVFLETIGETLPRYVCPFCGVETEHGQRLGDSGDLFAICLTCAQGSIVVPDEEEVTRHTNDAF